MYLVYTCSLTFGGEYMYLRCTPSKPTLDHTEPQALAYVHAHMPSINYPVMNLQEIAESLYHWTNVSLHGYKNICKNTLPFM